MNTQVIFKRKVNFTGRNGYFTMSGVDIQTLDHSENVMLTPLTGKGNLARCDMEIPYEHLPSFIGELKEAFIQMTEARKQARKKQKS